MARHERFTWDDGDVNVTPPPAEPTRGKVDEPTALGDSIDPGDRRYRFSDAPDYDGTGIMINGKPLNHIAAARAPRETDDAAEGTVPCN